MVSEEEAGQYTEFTFALEEGRELSLTFVPGAFMPTGTTRLLISAAEGAVSGPVDLLDLGCGTGIVGLALYLRGRVRPPLFASDVSEVAGYCSRVNLERHGCPSEVRVGSLFEPWRGHTFDVIVDDISGVAEEVAAVSPWFDGVPCESGRDGTALIVNILGNASKHLRQEGRFLFPVLSLSDVETVLDKARAEFNCVERLARQEWPLPEELRPHIPLLERLNDEGCIRLERRFGMVLWYTEIYCASNLQERQGGS